VIDSWQEQDCLTIWLSERAAELGAREYAIGLRAASPPDADDGWPLFPKLYNVWEWAAAGPAGSVPAQPLAFPPPWNWEGGRGGGDCGVMLIGNHEQNGWWRRRGCTGEPVYGICERYQP
jgi:hypothetical protein